MELDASLPCSDAELCSEQNESSQHSHSLVFWAAFWYVILSTHVSYVIPFLWDFPTKIWCNGKNNVPVHN
jgi:hypothetical protein